MRIHAAPVLALCALSAAAAYASPGTVTVDHHDGEYTVIAELEIKAPLDAAWRVLTDYPGLGRLSDAILESRVVEHAGAGTLVDTVTKRCFGPFCNEVRHRQYVFEYPPTDIVAITVPDASDFSSGTVRWMFAPTENGDTFLRYEMRVVPTFFIPPLIGQGIVRRALTRETRELIEGIEREVAR